MIINYSDQDVIKGKKSIFLAGPTPRSSEQISWRIEACNHLQCMGFDGIVYVPEYSSWKPKTEYIDQALWEREALTNASVIVFWIPRNLKDMPAFTTNVEFGYWIHTGKIIYGRPDNAAKIKYLDWLYKEDMGLEPINNLENLLKEAMSMTDRLYDGEKKKILSIKERKILNN